MATMYVMGRKPGMILHWRWGHHDVTSMGNDDMEHLLFTLSARVGEPRFKNVLTSSGRTHRAIKGSSYGGSVSSEKLTLAFFLQSCKTKSGVGMSWAIDYEDMYTIHRQ